MGRARRWGWMKATRSGWSFSLMLGVFVSDEPILAEAVRSMEKLGIRID